MSVQTQIDRISGAVQSALAALAEKGVTVPAGTKVDGLAALIAAIETGGGSGAGGDNTFATGTFISTVSGEAFNIEHNLGRIPSLILVWAKEPMSQFVANYGGHVAIKWFKEDKSSGRTFNTVGIGHGTSSSTYKISYSAYTVSFALLESESVIATSVEETMFNTPRINKKYLALKTVEKGSYTPVYLTGVEYNWLVA